MRIEIITAFFLFAFINDLNTQLPFEYFEIGDTLNVVAISGLNFRDQPSDKSNVLKIIPFKSKVFVQSRYYEKGADFQNRYGGWIKVTYENDSGYVFSGFLTNKTIPDVKVERHNCFVLDEYYDFIKANLGDTLCSGVDTLLTFGKGGAEVKKWTKFEGGDEVLHDYAYENYDIRFSTYRFSMNDVLNFLELYIRKKCRQDFDSFDINVSKKSYNNHIRKIECTDLQFIAELSLNKLIVKFKIFSL